MAEKSILDLSQYMIEQVLQMNDLHWNSLPEDLRDHLSPGDRLQYRTVRLDIGVRTGKTTWMTQHLVAHPRAIGVSPHTTQIRELNARAGGSPTNVRVGSPSTWLTNRAKVQDSKWSLVIVDDTSVISSQEQRQLLWALAPVAERFLLLG